MRRTKFHLLRIFHKTSLPWLEYKIPQEMAQYQIT